MNASEQGRRRHRTDPVLLVISGVLFACAAGGAVYLVDVVRHGDLDARPEHAPRTEPNLLTAAEEPFWFYGLVAALAVLVMLLLVIAWRMLLHARNPR